MVDSAAIRRVSCGLPTPGAVQWTQRLNPPNQPIIIHRIASSSLLLCLVRQRRRAKVFARRDGWSDERVYERYRAKRASGARPREAPRGPAAVRCAALLRRRASVFAASWE